MSLPPGDLTRREAIAGALVAAASTTAQASPDPRAGVPDQAEVTHAPLTQAPETHGQESQLQETQANGTVFEDHDGTARPGPDNAPIQGILVSNGRDITRTDEQGRWSLAVRDGDSIFVIKPSGWSTPIDQGTNLPRFAHIHCPAGTPDLGMFYAGVPPTGSLPESLDFPLRRHPEPDSFAVLLFADPQPESPAELDFVRDDVITRAAGTQAAFAIMLGDIMFDDLAHYDRHNRILGTLGMPVYNLPGNHDMNMDAPANRYSRETFKRVYGARHHAWQYGGATFAAFDNVEHLGGRTYRGHFAEAQLSFLRNLIAAIPADSPLILCMHIPLRTLQGDEPNTATIDWQDVLDVIGARPRTISFAGHTHTNEHHYLGANHHHHHVLTAASGSWWSGPDDVRGIPDAIATDGSPNGFHVLSISANALSTKLVPAHTPASMRIMVEKRPKGDLPEVERRYRMGQLLDGSLAADETGEARLVVNLFDGGPRSTVSFSLDGGVTTTVMVRAERHDPFVEEVFARHPLTRKPWVHPSLSSHIWQARLPVLAPGTYHLTVQATDEVSRPIEASQILEVA